MSDSQLYAISVGLDSTPSVARSVRTNGSYEPKHSRIDENSSSLFSSNRSLRSTAPSSASILTSATSHDDILATLPLPSRTSYSNTTSRPTRSQSISKRTGNRSRVDSLGASDPNELPGDDPTSEELRQEIADLESECKRVVESFEGLEVRTLAKYRATPTSHGPVLPPGLQHLTKLTDERTPTNSRPTSPSVERSGMGGDRESINSRTSSLRRMGSFLAKNQPKPKSESSTSPSRKPPSSFPSSKLSEADMKIGNGKSTNGVQVVDGQVVVEVKGSNDEDAKLVQELEELRKRRRTVEEKYEERLEYLRARLRGALIKEGISK
ncbi:hypothetical protein BT69DRAFT_1101597 [Atractiella rhizophila]|nr:hypothetical protein BT69DRAFT_1101597 [Atractiella rhizophila]